MTTPTICPACSATIPLADVNVATDIALCRACGATHPFSALLATGDLLAGPLGDPPRFVREGHDGQADLLLTYRKKSPALLFLIPFTALWGGLSVGMIYVKPFLTGKTPPVSELLFGLPFLFGTVVLLSIITYMLFGRWEIRVTGDEGTAFTGVGPWGFTRRFRLDRTSRITLAECGTKVNDRPVPCIRIETENSTCSFGAFIHEDSKRWLTARLLRHAQRR
jgi:hypothetical protein